MRFFFVSVRFIVSFGFALLLSVQANAASAIALSIVPSLQVPTNPDVAGLSLGLLWSSHRSFKGLAFGALGTNTQEQFDGLEIGGIFNRNRDEATIRGLQISGLSNLNYGRTKVFGMQAAVFENYILGQGKVIGAQVSLQNMTAKSDVYGLQLAGLNIANHVYGLQIGVVNIAEKLHGLQIGLVNINRKGTLPFLPFINADF